MRLIERTLEDSGIPGAHIYRREQNGDPVVTDSGNFIIDCKCGQIPDPAGLETALNMIPGVAENGLFTRESAGMVVGHFDGSVKTVLRSG